MFVFLPHLEDLAVLSSRQDSVGPPADAANRQTWRRKRRKRIPVEISGQKTEELRQNPAKTSFHLRDGKTDEQEKDELQLSSSAARWGGACD